MQTCGEVLESQNSRKMPQHQHNLHQRLCYVANNRLDHIGLAFLSYLELTHGSKAQTWKQRCISCWCTVHFSYPILNHCVALTLLRRACIASILRLEASVRTMNNHDKSYIFESIVLYRYLSATLTRGGIATDKLSVARVRSHLVSSVGVFPCCQRFTATISPKDIPITRRVALQPTIQDVPTIP
jgi:hypothetical protein